MIEKKNDSSGLRPRRRPVRRPPQRLKAALELATLDMLPIRLDSRRRWEERVEDCLYEVLAELRQQGVGAGGGDVGLQQLHRQVRVHHVVQPPCQAQPTRTLNILTPIAQEG